MKYTRRFEVNGFQCDIVLETTDITTHSRVTTNPQPAKSFLEDVRLLAGRLSDAYLDPIEDSDITPSLGDA